VLAKSVTGPPQRHAGGTKFAAQALISSGFHGKRYLHDTRRSQELELAYGAFFASEAGCMIPLSAVPCVARVHREDY
jgi:hypothetical protein